MKKKTVYLSVAFIFACLLLCAAAFGAVCDFTAHAENAGGGIYARFGDVTAVYCDESGFAVADENGFYFYKNGTDKVEIPELAGAVALLGDKDTRFAVKGGKVYAYTVDAPESGAFAPQSIIGDESFMVSFAAMGDGAIYCASKTEIRKYGVSGERDSAFSSPELGGKNIVGLAAANGKVYYSVNKNKSYSDIYETGGTLLATVRSDGAIAGGGSSVYSILRGGRVATVGFDGESAINDNDYAVAIYADKNGALCYATDIGEILRLDGSSGAETVLAASESSRDGYYSQPSYAVARMGKLVICDTLNDRIAVLGSGDRSVRSVKISGGKEVFSVHDGTYRELPRPTAAHIDNCGNIYVAYAARKIAVFDSELQGYATYSCPSDASGKITALTGDNRNNVYALVGGVVYKITTSGGEAAFTRVFDGADTIAFAAGGDKMYYSSGSVVYSVPLEKIGDGSAAASVAFTAPGRVSAVAVDRAGNVFCAAASGSGTDIIRHDSEGDAVIYTAPSDNAAISISLTQSGGASYGDVVVTDGSNSKIVVIDGSEVGVNLSVGAAPEVRPYDREGIVRRTINACSVYGTPNETDAISHVGADAEILAAKYDVDGFPDYSYVYYEDKITAKLVRGFVFKSNLSEPADYAKPPAETGYVYGEGSTLYDMPSICADPVIKNIPKNTHLKLLPFTDYTSSGTRWYRVVTDDDNASYGYIPVSAVSVRGFVPDGARPQYNAVIKSYNGSVGAKTYSLNADGSYSEIEQSFLLTGTKVEVVGAFDTSEKYTQIKYFDDRLGTCSCYVETVYIDYNNVSVVQIVAIIIAVITAILLVLLLVRIYMKKRKI